MKEITIKDNIQRVQETIAAACARSGRDPADVVLVAISKKKPPEAILAALDAGLRHFGENRVEESQEKIPVVNRQVEERPIWHMVGHIQSRKSSDIPPLFQMVHSVDRAKLARRLSRHMQELGSLLDVLLEINISGEAAKYGFDAANWQSDSAVRDALWQDVQTIITLPGLSVRGLMTMAPIVTDMEETRPVFAGLAALRDALATDLNHPLPDLSMGMTDDYPIAIEEGATLVRIGRAIFGERST